MPILILVAACVVLVIAMTGSYGAGLRRGRDEGWRQIERSTDEWYGKGRADGRRELQDDYQQRFDQLEAAAQLAYDRGYRDGRPGKDEKTGRFTKR